MSNRNFDSRYIIQRLMDRVNAQNLYGFQKGGVAIINNPQNSDPASYRIASYNAGAQTTIDRGLLGGGYSVSLGGIADLIDTVTVVPPEAPTGLVAQDGDTTVIISFTPGNDGGSPIINYEYSLDNGITFISFSPAQTISPLTISGLTNGTTYNIKIRAVNSSGPGQASAAVTATPFGLPGAPSISLINHGDAQLSIGYIAGSTGGSAIINYTYSTDNGNNFKDLMPQSLANPFTITTISAPPYTPLVNGTTYSIKIAAINNRGTGTASDASSGTPSTVPNAPVITSLSGSNQKLTVGFTLDSSGGSAITNYSYSTDNGTTFKAISPPQITITPFDITTISASPFSALVNGTTYQVRIKAINNNGAGTESDASAGTPSTVPSQPVITSITPSNQQLTVNFTQSSTGGAAITSYKYSTDNGAHYATILTSLSPLIIMADSSNNQPLVNGTTYPIKIIAVNAKGDSTASTTVNGTPAGAPSDPVIDDIVSGNQSLNVYYTQGSDGGSAITNYYYSTDNGATFVLFSPVDISEPLTITRTSDTNTTLENDKTYDIIIKANNIIGASVQSNMVSGTPSTFIPPTITVALPGDTEAYIYFTAGNTGGGSSITDYEYSLNSQPFISFGSITNPLNISSLINDTQYVVKIRSVNNNNNTSSSSNSITVTPVAYVAPSTATLIYDPTVYSGSGQVLNTGSGGTVTSTSITATWVDGAAGASSRKVFDFISGRNIIFGQFNFGTAITVTAWIYPRSGTNPPGVINGLIGNAGANQAPSGFKLCWHNWTNPTRVMYSEAGNGAQGGANGTVPNIIQYDQWQHLAYLFDRVNANMIFCWNGQPVAMGSTKTVSNAGMNNIRFTIGSFADNSYWMNAQLGVISVYKDTLLNAAQILEDYESTKANYGL